MKIAGVIMRIEVRQDGQWVVFLENEAPPLLPIFDEMKPLLDSLRLTEADVDGPPSRTPRADLRNFIQQRNDWHGRTGRRARGRKH